MLHSRFLLPAALGALLGTAACQPESQTGGEQNESLNAVSPLERLPVAEPAMDRAALLAAAAKAASAAALGKDDRVAQRPLDGMPFEVRIRFGCPAAAQQRSGPGTFGLRFTEEDRTLRIRATPDLTLADPRVAAIASGAAEAVEGFWMRRPWLLEDGCPAAAPPPPTEAGSEPDAKAGSGAADPRPSGQSAPASANRGHRIGLAEFFLEAGTRIARRDGRPYEATKVLAEGERPSAHGYNLVLAGRLRQLPGGRVINCVATDQNVPPDCVVSAQFDRVRIEVPGNEEMIAEWSR